MALTSSQRSAARKTLSKAMKQAKSIKSGIASAERKGTLTSRDRDRLGAGISGATKRLRRTSRAISSDSLRDTEKITIPTQPEPEDPGPLTLSGSPVLNQNGISVQDNQYVTDSSLSDTGNAIAESNLNNQQALQQYITNVSGEFDKTRGLEAEYLRREREAGIQGFQSQVNDYTAQLNAIAKNRDASILLVEGQGRGIPTTVIGGQQAKINREAAIASLPISAQLDAAQGNLDSATARVDKLFSMYREDVKNEFEFKSGLYKSALDFANASDAKVLQGKLADINSQNVKEAANLNLMNEWAKMAVTTGQSGLISQFTSLDPKSETFTQDFGNLQSLVKAPVAAGAGAGAPTIKSINGVDMQWDAATGTWVDPTTGGPAPQNIQRLASAQSNIEKINNVINSPAVDSTVGTSFLTRSGKGVFSTLGRLASVVGVPTVIGGAVDSLTGEKQNLIGDIKQLQSQLSLDSLVNAKANGATFGALSEKELKLLSDSATKLSTWEVEKDGRTVGYDTSEKAFKTEMDKIRNFAKLDYLLKGGAPEDIGVQVLPDGTYWVLNSNGSYTQLQ